MIDIMTSLQIVDIEKSLKVVGKKASLACDMLQLLLDSLDEDQKIINDASDAKDHASLLFNVHRLHGATLYCGVPQLTLACNQVETLLKNNHTTHLDSALLSLNQAIDQLRAWSKQNNWQDLFKIAL